MMSEVHFHMPHLNSIISLKIYYESIGSEIFRLFGTNSDINNFVTFSIYQMSMFSKYLTNISLIAIFLKTQ